MIIDEVWLIAWKSRLARDVARDYANGNFMQTSCLFIPPPYTTPPPPPSYLFGEYHSGILPSLRHIAITQHIAIAPPGVHAAAFNDLFVNFYSVTT